MAKTHPKSQTRGVNPLYPLDLVYRRAGIEPPKINKDRATIGYSSAVPITLSSRHRYDVDT